MADDFTFTIEEKIGVLSENSKGWALELNKVSWGGRPAKYDLRSWDPAHEKMGKGVTLTENEIKNLKTILDKII